jgi:alpha-mannosidase
MGDRGVLVVNDLPWERVVSGPIAAHVVEPRGDPGDMTSGRHFQDRSRERPRTNSLQPPENESLYASESVLLPPTEIPGYGYTVVPQSVLLVADEWPCSTTDTITTDRYRVTFDTDRGGIRRLYDTLLGRELVDETAAYPLGGFVHESPAGNDHPPRRMFFSYPPEIDDWKRAVAGIVDAARGFQSDWRAQRVGPEGVSEHCVYETPLGYDVRQRLNTPTVESDVTFRAFFPRARDEIVVEATWEMGMTTEPEATYLAFPFDVDDPTARIDVGGQPVRPGENQLPGACKDYFSVQRWVDVSNRDMGVMVGCPLNPMVQLGGFNFGRNRDEFSLDAAHVLGWVTNNYWDTNFRARQPGQVRARYHISPHAGPFDESRAHRKGAEAVSWYPIAQSRAEPVDGTPMLPPEGSLLDLPEPPVLVFQIRPTGVEIPMTPASAATGGRPGLIVGLQNASDSTRTATISSAELEIQRASVVGLLSDTSDGPDIPVHDDTVAVEMEPRRLKIVRVDFSGTDHHPKTRRRTGHEQ